MLLRCWIGGIAVGLLPRILGDIGLFVRGMQMHGTIVDD
jgi:hypothetical protein